MVDFLYPPLHSLFLSLSISLSLSLLYLSNYLPPSLFLIPLSIFIISSLSLSIYLSLWLSSLLSSHFSHNATKLSLSHELFNSKLDHFEFMFPFSLLPFPPPHFLPLAPLFLSFPETTIEDQNWKGKYTPYYIWNIYYPYTCTYTVDIFLE